MRQKWTRLFLSLILTDFDNSFTGGLSSNLVVEWLLKIRVTTCCWTKSQICCKFSLVFLRQHFTTLCVAAFHSLMISWLQTYRGVRWWRNFRNRWKVGEATAKVMSPFFWLAVYIGLRRTASCIINGHELSCCVVSRWHIEMNSVILELAATLWWFTAGGAIRIALRQLSQTWKFRHYDVIDDDVIDDVIIWVQDGNCKNGSREF